MVYCSGASSVAPVPLANPSLSLPGPTVPGMSSTVAPIVPSLGPTTLPGYLGLLLPQLWILLVLQVTICYLKICLIQIMRFVQAQPV